MKSIPKLIIVGGFLGAGKTTLLGRARQELESRGQKVGLITNDQAPGLVDTAWLGGGSGVVEVTGSCYCCDFKGFGQALQTLTQWGANVIIAEPVGSCADLSATVLQPLKDLCRDQISPTQFSVVLDPSRAQEVLGTKKSLLHQDALYILGRQVAEADLIVLNKIDLLSPEAKTELVKHLTEKYPGSKVVAISAKGGEGVATWLDGLLSGAAKPGINIVEMDYDRYAHGEAVLGWLNLTVDSDDASREGLDALTAFLEKLRGALANEKRETGHVKVLWPSPTGLFIGNLTDTHSPAVITKANGAPTPGPILVNARVESEPADLEKLVRRIVEEIGQERKLSVSVKDVYCLKPGRPNPTHRYAQVV
ncbi:MAG: cobalamin synthesis protein P47K [Deltaproteobacteria bacterium]|jgi:G3E family GTPase|nr:cobalamin synthesis protein P47K [Deltaproteobacteria bacterium]